MQFTIEFDNIGENVSCAAVKVGNDASFPTRVVISNSPETHGLNDCAL